MITNHSKFLYLFLYIHLCWSHNILRIGNQRLAKFQRRHEGKVQAAAHYKEFPVGDLIICMDRCVADNPCKSFNFYNAQNDQEQNVCQLVSSDITDGNNYVERLNWDHYDTGRSKLTRLRHRDNNYCYVPHQKQDCTFNGGAKISALSMSDSKCSSILAYFEYDRHTGIITHFCSGKVLCPKSYGSWSLMYVKEPHTCDTLADTVSKSYKYRTTFGK